MKYVAAAALKLRSEHHSAIWTHFRVFHRSWAIILAALTVILFSPATRAATLDKTPIRGSDLTLITISGPIEAGDQETFSADIQGLHRVWVAFDSPGGNLIAGLEIGRKIRAGNFVTVVPAGRHCVSVCALMWLAGTQRFLEPSGSIGFHAAYVVQNGIAAESGVGNALVGAYLRDLGLGENAIIYITQASPDEITWLDEKSATELGIRFMRMPDNPSGTSRNSRLTQPGQSQGQTGSNAPPVHFPSHPYVGSKEKLLSCPANSPAPGAHVRVLLTVAGDDPAGQRMAEVRWALQSLSGVDLVDSPASADLALHVVIQEQTLGKRTIGYTASYVTAIPCVDSKQNMVELKGQLGTYTDTNGPDLASDLAGMLGHDLQPLRGVGSNLSCPANSPAPGAHVRVLLTVAGDDPAGQRMAEVRWALQSLSGVDLVDSPASADLALHVVIQEQTLGKRTIGYTASYVTAIPCVDSKQNMVELKGQLGTYTDTNGPDLASDLAGMLKYSLSSP